MQSLTSAILAVVLVTAQFPGRCPDCGEHIHLGDTIVRRSNGWCCTECEP